MQTFSSVAARAMLAPTTPRMCGRPLYCGLPSLFLSSALLWTLIHETTVAFTTTTWAGFFAQSSLTGMTKCKDVSLPMNIY